MKKRILTVLLCLAFGISSVCGCTAAGSGEPSGASGGKSGTEQGKTGESDADLYEKINKKIERAEARKTCRVISSESGSLLLAEQEGRASDVYRIQISELDVIEEKGKRSQTENTQIEIPAGALVEIGFDGMIQESYPARLGEISGVKVLADGYNDMCAMYMDVLEKLWETDPGLNSEITQLGVDLSKTSLAPAEQSALAWAFSETHGQGLELIEGTWQELVDEGYIDEEKLVWEDGCLFSITEKTSKANKVKFDAEKWRSGMGAYIFYDCTSKRSHDGSWSEFKIGTEAIA